MFKGFFPESREQGQQVPGVSLDRAFLRVRESTLRGQVFTCPVFPNVTLTAPVRDAVALGLCCKQPGCQAGPLQALLFGSILPSLMLGVGKSLLVVAAPTAAVSGILVACESTARSFS